MMNNTIPPPPSLVLPETPEGLDAHFKLNKFKLSVPLTLMPLSTELSGQINNGKCVIVYISLASERARHYQV